MWRRADLVLRYVYVALAPLVVALFATVMPITGTMIGAGLALVVGLIGAERWTAVVGGVPVVGRALGNLAALGAFYREHPPKLLVYYIAYPLLLPVILFRKVPRREFLLYRKLNALALGVVVVIGAVDYFRNWRPELSFGQFATGMVAGLFCQLIATFALAMPIVTTLIGYAHAGHKKALWSLGALAALSGLGGIALTAKLHGMQMSTWMRLKARTDAGIAQLHECEAAGKHARDCVRDDAAMQVLGRAMDKAWDALQAAPTDPDAALAAARAELAGYYKPDEARAWRLYYGEGTLVLYVRFGKRLLWIARDAKHVIVSGAKLPPGAIAALDRRN